MAAPRVIDLHAHVVIEDAYGKAGPYGPEMAQDEKGVPYFRIGNYQMKPMQYKGTVFTDVTMRLEQMEKVGIDLQLLSPNPLTMFHLIDAENAIRYCKTHNDAMAKLVSDHPEKLLGSAALPMQDLDAAMSELERCVRDLGLKVAYTGTDYAYPLDDPCLDDFYRTLVALDVPLFMHPASTGGAEGPADKRMERFDLGIVFGYAVDETLATASLILGGVLDRHPALDICISHGGGTIPFVADRFDGMADFRARMTGKPRSRTFRERLKGLWFDAHVEGDAPLHMLVDMVGTEKLVWGTNFGGWDTPQKADDFAASLTGNAERLLRLE